MSVFPNLKKKSFSLFSLFYATLAGNRRETQEDEFCEYFAKYGSIKEHTIKKDEIGRSKGFGFILFEEPGSVDKVLSEENHCLGNRKIQPKKATPKERVRKIFVGGVSPELAEEEIRKHFEQFGEIGTTIGDKRQFYSIRALAPLTAHGFSASTAS